MTTPPLLGIVSTTVHAPLNDDAFLQLSRRDS